MSEELNPPPVVPSVRFGLRSMVAVTSIATIFAAAAAPLSWGASENSQRHLAVAWCTTLASVAATYVFYPRFVCEEGIPLGKNYVAPWKYIRHAEWQTDRPETLKLHRLDGDIYLDVPNEVRAEVEEFVRGKTLFVDDVASPPV